MVSSRIAYTLLVVVIGGERLVELALSRRNARRAFARGGVEVGQAHYLPMKLFHGTFLLACVAEVWLARRPFPDAVGWCALAVTIAAQGLRYWVIATLGERWNTRVIVLPGAEPVTGGPYRFVRHPNYVAVVAELASLPLIHGAWLTALVFSATNALLLSVRIRTEERALGELWARRFSTAPRFIPGGSRE